MAALLAGVLVGTAACGPTDPPPTGTGTAPPDPPRPAVTATATASPDLGLDDDLALRLEGAAADHPGVRAVLVARYGQVAAEFGDGLDRHSNVYSVTKSVLGTLTGIAIGDGDLALDTRVGDLLAGSIPAGADPRVAELTVEELLTMTAGLPGDAVFPSPPPEGSWVTHALGRPLGPTGRFDYSSTTSHVLGAMVAAATGTELLTYARARLFEPLGIDTDDAYTPELTAALPSGAQQQPYADAEFAWPTDPDGLHVGYCCLKLTPHDLLALGQLWLQEGRWDGEQLVPADYLRAATTAPGGEGYGYHWWVTTAGGHRAFHASGLGGQLVYVVPDLDLVVVVVSSSLLGAAGSHALVTEVVLPAVR